jgi:DNA-binding XRE family transcriptional regulator
MGKRKLSVAEHSEIRELYASGKFTQTSLAVKFGVSQQAIQHILRYDKAHNFSEFLQKFKLTRSLGNKIKKLIAKYPPIEEEDEADIYNYKPQLYKLCGQLKALPGLEHILLDDLKPIAEEYYNKSGLKQSFEAFLIAFNIVWNTVSPVYGENIVQIALTRAKKNRAVLSGTKKYNSKQRLLVKLCYELQEMTMIEINDEPAFYLSGKKAGEI